MGNKCQICLDQIQWVAVCLLFYFISFHRLICVSIYIDILIFFPECGMIKLIVRSINDVSEVLEQVHAAGPSSTVWVPCLEFPYFLTHWVEG